VNIPHVAVVFLELLHVFDGGGGLHLAVLRDDFVKGGVDVLGHALGGPGAVLTVDATGIPSIVCGMKGEFTAIIEAAPEGGYWAICPEVPGANGQGETVEEAKTNLREAIRLIFEDRIEDARRGLPDDAIQTVIAV
jgi:predicted RNase H-like HicB family nuclease